MIPAKYKISQKNFLSYMRGKHIPFTLGTIIISSKNTLTPGYAVVVSKKVAPKAHDRNTIKRFFYGVLRKHLNYLKENNTSIIILLKTKIPNTRETFSSTNTITLEREIENICLKK